MPVSPIAKTIRNNLAGASLLLFTAALTQTAFHWGPDQVSSGPGWLILLRGWRGLSAGYIEWIANPLLLVGWAAALRDRRRAAAVCGVLATVTMLIFPLRAILSTGVDVHGLRPITTGPGYWLWLCSALLMACIPQHERGMSRHH